MCGIAGYWGGAHVGETVVERMARRLQSRGPDDFGTWLDKSAGVGLGHRRLAILDLSPAGHQPMVSPCGRYVIVYNGEIYNHLELRMQLEAEGGHFAWHGYSDTETLLAALRHWGLQGALTRLNGMFAFAVWDASERTLVLARDRMGEKPLYYGRNGDTFLFGSELKALTAHPEWRGEIDRDVLALYMRHNCVPAPWSIYKGIAKLSPAHFVVIRDDGRAIAEPQCYWSLHDVAEQGTAAAQGEANALTDELDGLLRSAIGMRMTADVPLGAFLSGGYDSSIVVALMQALSTRPVKTFSLGSGKEAYNEAKHAKVIARHLGTEHTELYVTPEQALDVVPRLPKIYDEPFADSSQIPTFLVSQLARQEVTVSLSGDGGDELFAGYNRHMVGPGTWRRVSAMPAGLRRMLGTAVGDIAQTDVDRWSRCLPKRARVRNLANKLEKLGSALQAKDSIAFYKDLVSHWKNPASAVSGAQELETVLDRHDAMPELPGLREQMMYLDLMSYLPDDILTKVDRASMAVGLEARVPLLDHRLVEFAWRVPSEYRYRDGKGKWLLRQVLDRYVPQEFMDRPKQGFGVPIGDWLRGPLRGWADELLSERRLRHEGFFEPRPIRKMWEEHLSGKRRGDYHLWDVLMFQSWLEETR